MRNRTKRRLATALMVVGELLIASLFEGANLARHTEANHYTGDTHLVSAASKLMFSGVISLTLIMAVFGSVAFLYYLWDVND